MKTFAEMGVRGDIHDNITALGYLSPTAIQAETIPAVLAGTRDLVALAQTGTGKTAAFGIPLVQLTDTSCSRVQVLVLCPTRELCVQVAGDMTGYADGIPDLGIAAVYGGASVQPQINALRRGAQIVVATPGRLNDLIRRKKVDLTEVRFMALDEADEMLQMGFQEELNAILDHTPSSKTTLFFSATMPSGLSRISARYLKDPLEITVGQRNAGAENIRHVRYLVQAKHRYAALRRIVDHDPDLYAIIFCRTRQETREVADNLMRDGYNADALHGDLSQSQRDLVMGRFRKRHLQLLVATDVAARGLDVDNVTHVVNYTLPDDDAVYIHRSGRTGRAGKAGISVAIINVREKYKIRAIEKKLGKRFERCRIPTGSEVYRQQVFRYLETFRQVEVDHMQMDPILTDIFEMLGGMDREELLKRFITVELDRFLSDYKEAPDLNASDKKSERKASQHPRKSVKRKISPKKARHVQFANILINVGKKDGVNPGRLIGRINDISGRSDIKIGKIKIKDSTVLLEAESRYSREVLDAFSHLMINGKPVSAQFAGIRNARHRPKKPAGN